MVGRKAGRNTDHNVRLQADLERQGIVLDLVFVAVAVAFFTLSVGYVALCDALDK